MAVQDSGLIAKKSIQKGKYVAGRDIIISEERNLTIHKTKFVNTNLEPYKEGRYVVPTFRDSISGGSGPFKLLLYKLISVTLESSFTLTPYSFDKSQFSGVVSDFTIFHPSFLFQLSPLVVK